MRAHLLAIASCLAASSGACESARGPVHGRRDPGTLIVAQAADVNGLDPVRVTDVESVDIGDLLFEGLVGWKAGTLDIEPRLATRWEVSADGRTWTFHLRDHVRFHDGTPFDAAAVVFSFNRLLDPHHPSLLPDSEGSTYWRFQLKDVREVVAVDPRTVEIRTSRSYAPLLADLVEFPMVSPTAVSHFGDLFRMNPVGTGPYAFEAWTPGEQVVVRRFDGYWGPAPALERVVFQVVVDARQRLIELESGSVDLATAILPDEQPFVQLHPDLVVHAIAGDDVSYLAFNTQRAPFDDPRVRRAVSHAINKEPIVKLAYQGRAIPADGPLPPTSWAYHAPAKTYGYDPKAAKKLLAEAAADGKFDAQRVYTLYAPSTPRGYLPQPERVARFLQAALEQVGIHTDLVLQPIAEHRADVEIGKHDLCLFGWIGDTGDPDNFLYVLFHSDNAMTSGAQNIAFYRDAAVDQMLLAAQGTADEKARASLYAAVQDKLAIDAPWVPLAHSELVVAARAEIEHVVLTPTGHPIYPLITRAESR